MTAKSGQLKASGQRPVQIVRYFAVPPHSLFDAWVTTDLMRRWMFASPANEIREIKLNRQVGGIFSILEWSGTEEIDHFGEYLAIERPHRLVFTLKVPKRFPGTTCVAVNIARNPVGSLMTFTQTGVDKTVTEGNWRDMFEMLAMVLSESN
jgi:uncharacterized protein YndB with AHSA1/START domain